MFSSADVEDLIIENPEIDARDIGSINMKATERTTAELMKFATSLSLLRIEFQCMA